MTNSSEDPTNIIDANHQYIELNKVALEVTARAAYDKFRKSQLEEDLEWPEWDNAREKLREAYLQDTAETVLNYISNSTSTESIVSEPLLIEGRENVSIDLTYSEAYENILDVIQCEIASEPVTQRNAKHVSYEILERLVAASLDALGDFPEFVERDGVRYKVELSFNREERATESIMLINVATGDVFFETDYQTNYLDEETIWRTVDE